MAHPLTPPPERRSAKDAEDRTIAFYDADPGGYSRSTLSADLSQLYPAFLGRIPTGGLLLDAGSGSGRDTREFLARGYRVEAFDASGGMAALASRLTGVNVEVARFKDWSAPVDRYDGIWCFASLLHVAQADLSGVVGRLVGALRPDAPLFASFKRGDGETVDARGRLYSNLTVEAAERFFGSVPGLDLVRVWQDDGPTALGDPTRWVYVLAVRAA